MAGFSKIVLRCAVFCYYLPLSLRSFFNNGIMMDTENKKGDVSNKIVGRDEVERLIEDYGHKGSGLSMEEKFGYLRNEKTIVKVRIISFPLSDESRVKAILREYKDYSQFEPENYTHFVFCLEYSMSHPLLMDEEQIVRDFCSGICPAEDKVLFYTAENASLKDKLLLTIIASR